MLIKDYEVALGMMKNSLENLNIKEPKVYANFLAQTYYYVSHSTRLLAFSGSLLSNEQESIFKRFIHHINEESSHEILAERDMKALNYIVDDFPEIPATKMLWETQYYKILHKSPLAFMGYVLALEAYACKYFPRFLEDLQQQYPEKALKFVRLHAEEDPDHVDKAIALIETFTPEMQEIVSQNMLQTAKAYSMMLDDCNTL